MFEFIVFLCICVSSRPTQREFTFGNATNWAPNVQLSEIDKVVMNDQLKRVFYNHNVKGLKLGDHRSIFASELGKEDSHIEMFEEPVMDWITQFTTYFEEKTGTMYALVTGMPPAPPVNKYFCVFYKFQGDSFEVVADLGDCDDDLYSYIGDWGFIVKDNEIVWAEGEPGDKKKNYGGLKMRKIDLSKKNKTAEIFFKRKYVTPISKVLLYNDDIVFPVSDCVYFYTKSEGLQMVFNRSSVLQGLTETKIWNGKLYMGMMVSPYDKKKNYGDTFHTMVFNGTTFEESVVPVLGFNKKEEGILTTSHVYKWNEKKKQLYRFDESGTKVQVSIPSISSPNHMLNILVGMDQKTIFFIVGETGWPEEQKHPPTIYMISNEGVESTKVVTISLGSKETYISGSYGRGFCGYDDYVVTIASEDKEGWLPHIGIYLQIIDIKLGKVVGTQTVCYQSKQTATCELDEWTLWCAKDSVYFTNLPIPDQKSTDLHFVKFD